MENPKKKITNKEVFSLGWWAIKFWWKHDKSGFLLYLFTEVYDGVSVVIGSYLTGLLISQLLKNVQAGAPPFTSVWWIIAVYGVYLFMGYLSGQINRVSTNQRNVRIVNILERLYAYKFQELTLNDVDGRDFANKYEMAKSAKANMANRFVNFANLIKYPAIVLLVSVPLIYQGYWYVVLLVSILVLPVSITNANNAKKRVQYRLDNVENVRGASETVNYFQNSNDSSKEIKIHGAHELFIQKGTQKLIDYSEHTLTFEKEWFWQRVSLNILDMLMNIGVIIAYIMKVGSDVSKIGGILPYTSMVGKVRITILNFIQQYTTIAESVDVVIRVKEFLEFVPTKLFAVNGEKMNILAPAIDIQNLKFSYPNTEADVLNGISFTINSGEKIAIVGENGVGKTTLLKLIMGMYKPSSGQICINNKNLFAYAAESYYSNLGVLFQAFPQYPALNVRDNVSVGRYSKVVDDEKVIEALKLADAWDFVEKYPKTLDQVLSHRYKNGISPSTGQWQKLAIARLFYRNPTLVLFDEPTSSIDAESEYKIFNEIFSFFKEKTVVIVSHRFSTVRNADKIIVLNEGRIAEQGTHSELLALQGIYASAYQTQAEGYKD